MGNCKDCAFWDEGGNCGPGGEWAICRYVDDQTDPLPGEGGASLVLVADDDRGVDGVLRTGPMFGCVLFEARKDDNVG